MYALNGQVKIRVDEGDWQTIKPGQEFIVQSNQLHEGIVGPEGWEYLAGWDEEEAKQYKGVKH